MPRSPGGDYLHICNIGSHPLTLLADVAIMVTVEVVGTAHNPAGTGSALKNLTKCLKE